MEDRIYTLNLTDKQLWALSEAFKASFMGDESGADATDKQVWRMLDRLNQKAHEHKLAKDSFRGVSA